MESKNKCESIGRRLAQNKKKIKILEQAVDEDVAQLQEQNKNMFETIIKQEREIISFKRKIQDQDSELKKTKRPLTFFGMDSLNSLDGLLRLELEIWR